MLKIPFRTTDTIALSKPIFAYLRETSSVPPEQYKSDLADLDKLRDTIRSLEIHENNVHALLRYFGQLVYLAAKVPLNESEIKVPWRWYTAFHTKPGSSHSLEFEKASLVFNLGALYNQLGHATSKSTTDGLKKAAFYFQNAAGMFQELVTNYMMELQRTPSSETSLAALNAFVQMNLGLAQECFYKKAVLDQVQEGKMKDATISKLAASVSDFMNKAYEHASTENGRQIFNNEWLSNLQAIALFHNAAGHFRKSKDCVANGKYGEEIGRLQVASIFVDKGLEFHKNLSANLVNEFKSFQSLLAKEIQRATKDNDIIYLDPVPAPNGMSPLEKAALAQPTPFPTLESLKPTIGTPLLATLYPHAVQVNVRVYVDRRDLMVKSQIDKVNQAKTEYTRVLETLGLPGSIQAFEQPMGLPASLLAKSEEVRQHGGAQSLREEMQSLTVLAEEADSYLKSIERALNDEKRQDEECKTQFQGRWTRAPSSELQKNMRDQLAKYKKNFDLARKSDEIVRKKFETNLPFIESLGASKVDLEATIPASSQSSSLAQNNPVVKELKALVADGDKLFKERHQLLTTLKETASTDDVAPALLEAHGKKETNFEPVFDRQFQRYDQIKKDLEKSIETQGLLLQSLQSCNDQFRAIKQNNEGMKQRETALQNLESGYNAFKTLNDNLNEGIDFYTNLNALLKKLKETSDDFIFARNAEKKDHMADLTRAIANMNVSAAGNAPPLPPRQEPLNNLYDTPMPQPSAYPPVNMPTPGVWNPNVPVSYGNPPPTNPYYRQ